MKNKGFTLIELLVVVAIIGLLSSVVLASLRTARLKARDASIKSSVIQFRNILELNKNETGSYSDFQVLWKVNAAVTGDPSHITPCDIQSPTANAFKGNYAAKARELCNSIANLQSDVSSRQRFWVGVWHATPGHYLNTGDGQINNYSIVAYLPGKNTYFCIGSSGRTSETNGDWSQPGCLSNP
jgi:prepilin-type N-terminal cleavage/methylation domain-containing protein